MLGIAMTLPIRVLVVDDSAFMRRALSQRIELDPRFKVIGTAEDGQEGVDKALSLRPDVITLDINMPVLNGLEALRAIVAKSTIPVIMVSAQTHEGARVTMEALEIGAVDFVPKSQSVELIHDKLGAAVAARAAGRVAGRLPAKLHSRPVVPVRPAPRLRMRPRVIIVGSSTGGPAALSMMVQQLPAALPVPVVIAQHMPPHFTEALAKRLDTTCPPPVVEAKDGEPLLKKVYIAPGGMQLRLTPTSLHVQPGQGESLYNPSVDVLAESAHEAFGGAVMGIMLTGMGNDGAAGFARLRKAGAYIIAQDKESSVVWGMPRAVVEDNTADEVLPLDRVGLRISALVAG